MLSRLDEAGFAEAAFADRELANAVARHKSMFFAEKAADRTPIDYAAAVNGGLQLVPVGDGAKALEDDYARMVEDGLLFDDAEPFEALMARCADIAARANQRGQIRNWGDRGYMSEGRRRSENSSFCGTATPNLQILIGTRAPRAFVRPFPRP